MPLFLIFYNENLQTKRSESSHYSVLATENFVSAENYA